jgi:DNA polymerase (family 10)
MGCKFLISTDAHNLESLDYMKYGIDVARRGGLTKHDIVNTLSLENFIEKF